MPYAVISIVNGTYHVDAECSTEQQALVAFHNRCTVLWNAPDVSLATVKVIDQRLNTYNGHVETIMHSPEPEPDETE